MRLPAVLSLALFGALLAGCGKNGASPAGSSGTPAPAAAETPDVGAGGGRTQIAFIPHDAHSLHDQALHAGAAKAVGELRKGPDGKPIIDLLWQPPDNGSVDEAFTSAGQLQVARKLIASGIAAIIIVPRDPEALSSVAAAAAAHRIPVIALDVSVNSDGCACAICSDDQKASELAKAATGKTRIIGLADDPEKFLPALQSGELSALVLPDPLAEGYQSVKTAIDCIKEKKVPRQIAIPLHVATKENLADPAIAALLHPPIAQYLPDETPAPK
jgi:ABC-type sugar transport system substrate-binding protein